jgi:molybdopterin molybdotransferase
VRHADLDPKGETRLRVIERVMAGSSAAAALGSQGAIRIFTGAPMPESADTVFMQEDVRVEGANVVLPAGLKLGANARPAGEDVRAGERAAHGCSRLTSPWRRHSA